MTGHPTVAVETRALFGTNKSITGGDARSHTWQLLQEKIIKPANSADHQLLSSDSTLVTAEGQRGAIESKAQALGAHVTVEDDDFCPNRPMPARPAFSQGASRGRSWGAPTVIRPLRHRPAV